MDSQIKKPAMNQMIFDMGLSVETISVYLLCCGLADSDSVISTKNLLGVWNSTPAALFDGLKDLEKKNILLRIISDSDDNSVYKLTAVEKWKTSRTAL